MRCIKSLMSRTCVLYNVHTFLHQLPNSVIDGVSGSTGLFGGHRSGERDKIRCFMLTEMVYEHIVTPERAVSVAAV